MENPRILKNREKVFKLMAGGATIAMLFSLGKAGISQVKINNYLNQKETLLAPYTTQAPNDTLDYFRTHATEKEVLDYNDLETKEKASKTAQRNELSTAGAMFVMLGATGYLKLLNDDLIEKDKKLKEIRKEKETDGKDM